MNTDQAWQTSITNNAERAKYLLMTGLFSDCSFLVGTKGIDQEVIKAHKVYLSQSSPVFAAMISTGKGIKRWIFKNKPIALSDLIDLSPSYFKDLLLYVYTENVEFESMGKAMKLCYAAKKLMIPHLVAKCLQYVEDNLYPSYIFKVLEFSNLLEDDDLKRKCLSLIRPWTFNAYSDLFEELSESSVLSIVKQESLCVRELELFDAVVRWAGHQCTRKELEVNGTNLRHMLKDILKEIRFLVMSCEEFMSSPRHSGILTEYEVTAMLVHIYEPDSTCSMPIHLSASRIPRKNSNLYVFGSTKDLDE